MAVPRQIEEFLQTGGTLYVHLVHAPAYSAAQLARAEHVPERQIAKTVVFLGDGVFAMAVLPADERIDLEKLRRALGLAEVRLANEAELSRLFPDCEIGAMPPFGTLYGMPIYLDESFEENQHIEFNAGTHHDVIRMRLEEFRNLTYPIRVSFAQPIVQ